MHEKQSGPGRSYRMIAMPVIAAASCLLAVSGAVGQTLETDAMLRNGPAPYQDTVKRYLDKILPKIVGGQPAPDAAYPWQVSLGVSWIADAGNAHFCGGSVIDAAWILTAAHCIEGLDPHLVVITAGTNNLGNGDSQRRNVKRILYMSERYNNQTFDNDIALLELFEPLLIDAAAPTPQPVALATTDNEDALLAPEALLTVSGWGATGEGGDTTRTLRFVEVPPVLRDDCNAGLSYDGQITDNMICAGFLSGGQDSCQGDSGGPLTGRLQNTPYQAGIVSWGEGCARPRKPGVYSRVANYGEWINTCMASPEQCPK